MSCEHRGAHVHDVIVCSECQREERAEYERRIAELERENEWMREAHTKPPICTEKECAGYSPVASGPCSNCIMNGQHQHIAQLQAVVEKADAVREGIRLENFEWIQGRPFDEALRAFDDARKAVQR